MSADPTTLRGTVAIAGVAESDEMGKLPHKSALQLHMEATHNALADAGLAKKDIDAVFSSGRNTANDHEDREGAQQAKQSNTPV